MAKSMLQVHKKKTQRRSHNESYIVNKKYLGEEPVLKGTLTQSDLSQALTWYNYMCDIEDAREYIIDYLKANKLDQHIKKFKRVPNVWVPVTSAWVMRIHMRGGLLEDEVVFNSVNKVIASLTRAEAEKIETQTGVVISIQERISDRINDIIGDVENIVDNPPSGFSMYKHLQSNEIPAKFSAKIAEYYKPIAVELAEALIGKDEQLKEGYSHLTKAMLKTRLAFYCMIVEDCEKYGGNVRKQRSPRKKKTISADKKLKNFKYQLNDNQLKLSSIDPELILGSQELWTFNTKNKVLTHFKASG